MPCCTGALWTKEVRAMLIKHARDVEGKPIELLVKDGVIAAVGLDFSPEEGEQVLDAEAHPRL